MIGRRSFPTGPTPEETLAALREALAALLACQGPAATLAGIGISCGGPLDSRRGLVLSPPNLPGWDGIDVVAPFRAAFGAPTALPFMFQVGPFSMIKWARFRD